MRLKLKSLASAIAPLGFALLALGPAAPTAQAEPFGRHGSFQGRHGSFQGRHGSFHGRDAFEHRSFAPNRHREFARPFHGFVPRAYLSGPRPAQPRSAPISRDDLWICLCLFVATFLVYVQVRQFDFVNFDDPEIFSNSHVLPGLTLDGIKWALTSGENVSWVPLTRLSHLVAYEFFGRQSGLHHLTNVLFHALAALLLFAFLNRATRARWCSAFVAFLFALHPLHVESVAWVIERKDVLSAFFGFLALWAYVRYAESPGSGRYSLVLASFALSVLSKPMTITLPLVLLLLDVWPAAATAPPDRSRL